jgi:hypothetical protein
VAAAVALSRPAPPTQPVVAAAVPPPAAEPVAPLGSEWAGTLDRSWPDGTRHPVGITLTVTERQGDRFRWVNRNSLGRSAAVGGTLDPDGTIRREYSELLLPERGPRDTTGSLDGSFSPDRLRFTWRIPDGNTGVASLRRLPDRGDRFAFAGRWRVRRQSRDEVAEVVVAADGTLTGPESGTWTRDGGLIQLRYPADRDAEEWLVIAPDQPDRLLGGYVRGGTRQASTWERAERP